MKTRPDIEQLYAWHIKPLPSEDRLRLLAVMAEDLAAAAVPRGTAERSLLELEGLGAELWQGVDAQAYVDQLRTEWERQR